MKEFPLKCESIHTITKYLHGGSGKKLKESHLDHYIERMFGKSFDYT